MSRYEAVIGLEVHVRLATESKLFCSCSNKFGADPNSNVCEVCSGMPGALPAPNEKAVRLAALIGLATNCKINRRSIFARKNYFYPDLPAGYQISQFELPICEHGHITLASGKSIGITRIHMENDAGKNLHSAADNVSFVDLNRAGSPLVEIVSEPDLRSPAEAVEYLKVLHSLVTYLEVSDGNMEEGSFRCDANISIRKSGDPLGTRTELKNLNSFRHVQKALEYEYERQQDELFDGREIIQETRLYDPQTNVTCSMRSKEDAHDYRYFPDPDLLAVEIGQETLDEIKDSLPEMPASRCRRFMAMTGLPQAEVETLVQNKPLADFFEEASQGVEAKKVASYIIGPLARICNERGLPLNPREWRLKAEALRELAQIVDEGLISAKIAGDIIPDLFVNGQMPKEYVLSKGLTQISDTTAIEAAVDLVLAENPKEVESFKGGKRNLMSFFVGQVMRATRGKANPALVNQLISKKLG